MRGNHASIEQQAQRLNSAAGAPAATAMLSVKFRSAADMLAEPKPIAWLIAKVLERETLVLLNGAPTAGKSFLAIDMAACVATGKPFNGHEVHKGAVFFIAGEGHRGLSRRLTAWEIVHKGSVRYAPLYFSECAVLVNEAMSAFAASEAIRLLVEETGHQPALVVIDTLARNFGGDENSAEDVSQFITNCDMFIRQVFGCTVLIVHHTGHQAPDRGRGSSALRAAVDTELLATRNEKQTVLSCPKMKDAPELEPMAFEFCPVELPWKGEDGEPETSAIMRPCAMAEPVKKNARGIGSAQQRALDTLATLHREHEQTLVDGGFPATDARVSLDDWRDRLFSTAVIKHRNAMYKIKEALIERGLITVEAGGYVSVCQ